MQYIFYSFALCFWVLWSDCICKAISNALRLAKSSEVVNVEDVKDKED